MVFIPYNFRSNIELTIEEIVTTEIQKRGTSVANFGAMLYLFGFTSSMYHLLFIGIQRFYAIWKPFEYRMQSDSAVFCGLALVWVLAIVSATVPSEYYNPNTSVCSCMCACSL